MGVAALGDRAEYRAACDPGGVRAARKGHRLAVGCGPVLAAGDPDRLHRAVRDIPLPRLPGPDRAACRPRGSGADHPQACVGPPTEGMVGDPGASVPHRPGNAPQAEARQGQHPPRCLPVLHLRRRAASASVPRAQSRAGGVLVSTYGGLLVPPFSGREVYIGPFSWTPSWDLRAQVTGVFFADQLGPRAARNFVRSTGARFIFQECKGRVQPPVSLSRQIGPLVESTHDFGCARVYVLKPYPRESRVSRRVGVPDLR